MGNKRGHREAQNMEEMLSDMTEAKETGLSVRKGQSIYKQESGEYQAEKLRELVSMSINELATFATREKVALEDYAEVQKRTVLYLKACEESATFPSSLGLARSLGYSDRALRHWRNREPYSKTAQWLEMFSDTCADIMSQSALKNNANSIVAIFLNKALYNMRETQEIVITPNNPLNEVGDAEEVLKRRRLKAASDYEPEG